MTFEKLFEIQKVLDDRIVKKHTLEGKDLLPEKILALKVELGELANEVRVWKFWSEDREPRFKVPKQPTMNYEDIEWHNPVLEEYVDGIHFFLSIGIDLGINSKYFEESGVKDIEKLFALVYMHLTHMWWKHHDNEKTMFVNWIGGISHYLALGKALGFTWEQIEQAYFEKNKVNHARQESGY